MARFTVGGRLITAAAIVGLAVLGGPPIAPPVAAAQTGVHEQAPPPVEQSPPGANDWSCAPSEQHPNPVVLVHGLGANMAENWAVISPLLAEHGYCVFALTYGRALPFVDIGGVIPMERSAEELAAFVDRVLAATGAERVDLVGHSEGTLMPQYYLQFLDGARRVQRYVAVTPLYDGTNLLGLGDLSLLADELGLYRPAAAAVGLVCGSCPQFLTGSDYLRRMHAQPGGPAVPGVTYTTVMTRYDSLVVPYTSGVLDAPNATNIVVQDGC